MNPMLHWKEQQQDQSAEWRTENGTPLPKRVMVADDRITADQAFKAACEGCALLWRGDFHNAHQLLQALTRRIERKATTKPAANLLAAFHAKRQAQVHKTRILSMLLIAVQDDHVIALRRAPDLRDALQEAYGPPGTAFVTPLRELLGLNGAHEWRKKGIFIEALQATIHPHYGVFAPTRNEYIDLVAHTAIPKNVRCAFDIGTGTGVIAAILARRGVEHIIATDLAPRALACAQENLQRMGLAGRVQLQETNLFPEGEADLLVCNPPWLPARPSSALEAAIYDPDSQMLRGFLQGAAAHLTGHGQAWLILSDLAERIGMRTRDDLLGWIAAAGFKVAARHDVRPRHQRARDERDPLHEARSQEICSLWCLEKK